jgi:hypothetical protein
MRKSAITVLILVIATMLVASGWQEPLLKSRDLPFKYHKSVFQTDPLREQDPPPNYSFIPNGNGQSTTYLFDSYYDYMPFSYNGYNVRLQPEFSLPYGYAAGGVYVSYHCSETSSVGTDRRAFNSYINPDGTLFGSSATNHYDVIREGFTSVDIDPVTGDPFFVWHSVIETDGSWDNSMTYDMFHMTGATGFWKLPWIMMDNPEVSEGLTGNSDDEFNWPIVMVGGSPLDGHRRIHVYANNDHTNDGGNGNYNSLYAYADFNDNDLLMESEFEWTYKTFPYMDHLHYDDIARVNKDMIVKDNLVAFFGSFGDTLFVMSSSDYGENFTWYKEEWKFAVENPFQEDGVTYEFYNDDGITPAELFFVLSNDGSHFNGTFTANDTKLVWMCGVNLNTTENIDQDLYMAAFFYPKIFSFDYTTETFDFYDMDIQGADPADDQPAIPWDLDEDGEVDEFYADGSVYIPLSMCSWFFNTDQGYQDAFFHESNLKIVANSNWLVAGWHDSKKLRNAYFGEDGYLGWLKQPEMVFSISDDYGQTWSEPLYINANPNDNVVDPDNNYDNNFAAELDGQLPVNLTLGGQLEILSNDPGNYHAKLHLAYFDDNDYGSAAGQTSGGGELNGGKVRYAALDIEFQEPWIEPGTDAEDTIIPNVAVLGQNYPNPFNPETTIKYQVKADTDVKLEVFNIKGQKVKTLVNDFVTEGDYVAKWNGTDDNDHSVSSGVYFYKLRSGKETQTKKMVLLQ